MNTDFHERARKNRRRIVLPESADERILQAACYIDQQNIADISLIGNAEAVNKALKSRALKKGNIQVINPVENDRLAAYADTLFQLRSEKGLSREESNALVAQPLYFAAMMLHCGDADGCVAGACTDSASVIRAALQLIGTNTAKTRLSSFFIMQLQQPFVASVLFADCAINVSPSAEELVEIACQSAENARRILEIEPKIAMLSFSTNGSADHPEVTKVRTAAETLSRSFPALNSIGDIQFDAAISNAVLQNKWRDTTFQAPANVFIFPSLEAGNIGYKIAERLSDATATGPILQGLKKPLNDLSRGADVASIVNTIAVTCLQA